VFRQLAEQNESRVKEGRLMIGHVHMVLRILPKCAVSQMVGFINGKSAIHLPRVDGERKRTFRKPELLGSWVFRIDGSTRGAADSAVHRNQEAEDQRLDHCSCWDEAGRFQAALNN
jgi:putative transposase